MIGQCPRCDITNYTVDTSNGGAGRNVCNACGYRGPVAEFHGAFAIKQALARRDMESGVMLHKMITDLKTDTPAAPIRQYKDD